MAKFNSIEEIERKYNQKIELAKKRRTEALRLFANWINKKKVDTTSKDTLEKARQSTMEFVQWWIKKRDGQPMTVSTEYRWFCISCGEWCKIQWGHYIDRSYRATCCNTMNINGQCSRCNNKTRQDSDDMIRIRRDYTFAMVAKYGETKVRELLALKHKKLNNTVDDRLAIRTWVKNTIVKNTAKTNRRSLWQEMRQNGEIPQDILDEVGG